MGGRRRKVTVESNTGSVEEFTTVEDRFIEVYAKYRQRPIRVLLGLFRGHYGKFMLAGICFFFKHSPVWLSPIILANIINLATEGGEGVIIKIALNTLLLVCLIITNFPLNYLYTANNKDIKNSHF